MPRVRQNLRNKCINFTASDHCQGTMVVLINPTLWCASGCDSDSLDVWQSKEMRHIRISKVFAEIQHWYFMELFWTRRKWYRKNFSQFKFVLLEVLNLKCVTGPMPLTSVYPPLSRKYQRNCDWKNNMCSDPTNLFREMFYCLFQSSTVSSSSHNSIDDDEAIKA